jgi:uncharacterized membrane protein YqiK
VKGESLLRADAAKGEAEAQKIQRLAIAESETEAVKGESLLKKDQRISIKEADALAIQGENEANIRIARSEADRRVVEEETLQKTETAKVNADAQIQSANYEAEQAVQIKKAEKQKAMRMLSSWRWRLSPKVNTIDSKPKRMVLPISLKPAATIPKLPARC